MIIIRWQAPECSSADQIGNMFRAEGLSPNTEVMSPNSEVTEHRHPFDEIRMVAEGELHLNVAGNTLLLRAGDKIVISSNTQTL